MRTRQAIKNMIASLLLEVVLAISGIIVPRFFTALYGSSVNGLVSSISQFITYMSLVEAGIGAAGTVSLYEPLSKKDIGSVSEIVSAARKFYTQSGLLFVGLVAVLALVYPYVVQEEIHSTSFVRIMVLVLSVSGITDYFFLGKYRVLLQADQRSYVISFVQIIGTIVMTAVSMLLIELKVSALLVKGVTSAIYVLRSVVVAIYVRHNYPQISFNASPRMEAFSQRWSALLHQIVNLIVNNTHIILLTVMLQEKALAEVSVYSIYSLVGYALSSLLTSICNGVRSSFGQVLFSGETEILKSNYSSFEYLMLILIFIVYACMAVLIYPFIGLYSADFSDGIVYTRWPLVILFVAMGLIQSVRLPGSMLTIAAGHYQQTQGRAILEATINFVVAILLVRRLGIVGVLLGSCASYLYRSTDVLLYTAKNFVTGSLKTTARRLLINGILFAFMVLIGIRYVPYEMDNWLEWFCYAIVYGIFAIVVIGGINLLVEPIQRRACMDRIRGVLSKTGK